LHSGPASELLRRWSIKVIPSCYACVLAGEDGKDLVEFVECTATLGDINDVAKVVEVEAMILFLIVKINQESQGKTRHTLLSYQSWT
jgi:hypothetical protein